MIIDLIQPINLKATLLSGQAFRWKHQSAWFHGVIGNTQIKLRELSNLKVEFYCEPDTESNFINLLLDYLGFNYDINQLLDSDRAKELIKYIDNYSHGLVESFNCCESILSDKYSLNK